MLKAPDTLLMDDATYNTLADAVRRAADEQGITPSALQAEISAQWRREHS